MNSADANTDNPLVLVIDDEAIIRKLYCKMLAKLGYRAVDASNGETGLELFHELSPEMVLVDLRMPGKDGLEVLEILTATAPDVPVIVVSATHDVTDAINALRFGAWDFMLKPASTEIFEHTVNRCFERSRLIQQNKEFKRKLEQRLKTIREDEEAGRKIQARLLPPTEHHFGDYRISYLLQPSMYLSGDFVDFFEIGDDGFAFCLADVSGHGISSALVTVFLKSYMVKFRDRLIQQGDKTICHPAELVAELNAELLREELDKHMTFYFGIVDFARNTLSFVDAGQFPNPLLFTDEGVEVLKDKGMPVGLFDFATYETHVINLPSQFKLTLFSDGVLDLLGTMPLEEKLNQLEELATEGAMEKLLSETEDPEELPDDVTILTIERKTDG
jgi:phosphoserine phosphatase RsbU/P